MSIQSPINSTFRFILAFMAGLFMISVYADDDMNCLVVQAPDGQGHAMYFWQYTFADGSHDLAMAKSLDSASADIKRVTFGGSKEQGCHYQMLAIAKGSSWGWHLAWFDRQKQVLYYARMDGAAWVSSPPKRLAIQAVTDVRMQIEQQQVSVTWRANGKSYQINSDDEGRTWGYPQEMNP
jgi:hypothetical protein